jgi:hypothetical protein
MQGNPNILSGNRFNNRPNGRETIADGVFALALLKLPATIQVQSENQSWTFQAPAGASAWTATPYNGGIYADCAIPRGFGGKFCFCSSQAAHPGQIIVTK